MSFFGPLTSAFAPHPATTPQKPQGEPHSVFPKAVDAFKSPFDAAGNAFDVASNAHAHHETAQRATAASSGRTDLSRGDRFNKLADQAVARGDEAGADMFRGQAGSLYGRAANARAPEAGPLGKTLGALENPFAHLGAVLGGTSILQGGLEAAHGDPISGGMHAGAGALSIASSRQTLSSSAKLADAAETASTGTRAAATANEARAAVTALETREAGGGIPGLAALAATATADGETQTHGVRGAIGTLGNVQHGVSNALGGGIFGNIGGGLAAFGAAQPTIGVGLAKDFGVGAYSAGKSIVNQGVGAAEHAYHDPVGTVDTIRNAATNPAGYAVDQLGGLVGIHPPKVVTNPVGAAEDFVGGLIP